MAAHKPFMIVLGILVLTGITTGYYYSKNIIEEDKFESRNLLDTGKDNNTLWLYYDQSDVNSRFWDDFGSRSSRVLNKPYLNLCYDSIVSKNGTKYTVRVIAGLSDLATLLGGWKELPKPLQNPIATVNEAELNYIRATILRRFGGLWIDPSTIFLKPLPTLQEYNKVVFFGTDKDETFSDPVKGTPVPGIDVMYSPIKEHPVFIQLETYALARIVNSQGGRQFQKDVKWDLKDVMTSEDVQYIPNAEFARKTDGKRLQLEDLLSTNSTPVPIHAIYVPIDAKELEERRNFGWFLRMSEEQILESDLFITSLFN